MIYPYTVALHGVMALLSLLSSIYLFYRKRDTDNESIGAFFYWFLYYFIYNFILALSIIIAGELNELVGISYAIALVFQGFAAWNAFNVALNLAGFNFFIRKSFSWLYLLGMLIASMLHLIYFEIPIGTSDAKWVLWYSNQPRSLFFTFFMFVAGWTFALVHFKALFLLHSAALKMRAFFFALAAFILPFAAWFYFGAQDVNDIFFAFLFAILGLVFLAVGNVVIGVLKGEWISAKE
ncbi:hypothetical protein HYW53_02425 [Candidatus Giovannonibacteria bacterium]|nr:hypothetical protein [Candidatus Giovannonibacteria bacterium]